MLRSFGLFSLRMKEGGMFAMFQLTGGNLTKTPGGGGLPYETDGDARRLT